MEFPFWFNALCTIIMAFLSLWRWIVVTSKRAQNAVDEALTNPPSFGEIAGTIVLTLITILLVVILVLQLAGEL